MAANITPDTKALAYGAVGLGLVVFHAIERFNTPPYPMRRSTTTFGRYYLALAVYALAMIAIYALFSVFLGAHSLEEMQKSKAPGWVVGLPPQLYLALLLTIYLPLIPPMRQVDCRIRRLLHNMARIPFEAHRLSAHIRDAMIDWSSDRKKHVENVLSKHNIPASFAIFDDTYGIAQQFTKITWLMETLRKQSMQASTSRLMFIQAEEHGRLNRMFDSLAENVKEYQSTAGVPLYPANWNRPLLQSMESFRNELCDFLSCVVLYSSRTRAGMDQIVSESGFGPVVHLIQDRWWNRLALVTMCFTLILFIGLVMVPALTETPSPDDMPWQLKIPMIVSALIASMIAACMPKRWSWGVWKPTTNDEFVEEDRPWLTYVISGLAAGSATLLLMIVFRLLHRDSLADVQKAILQRWGWSILMFSIAATTAYFNDDPKKYRTRERQGCLHALMTCAAMFITQLCLALSGHRSSAIELIVAFGIAGIIGFVIGYYIPFNAIPLPIGQIQAKRSSGA